METATLASGCFWCTEAIFKRLKGVISVVSGYAGGKMDNPSYENVSTGRTGHAEAIQVKFDPNIISFNQILDVFWAVHDPTTLNKQGSDVGTQYRSVIFYHDDLQKTAALNSKKKLEESGMLNGKIVTGIEPFEKFFKAEDYHQNYYEVFKNTSPYCSIVIEPKIQKLLEKFNNQVTEEYK